MKTSIRWFRVVATAALLGVVLCVLAFLTCSDGVVFRLLNPYRLSTVLEPWRARQYANLLHKQSKLLLAADPVADALANARMGRNEFYTHHLNHSTPEYLWQFLGLLDTSLTGVEDPDGWLRNRYKLRNMVEGDSSLTPWERVFLDSNYQAFAFDSAKFPEIAKAYQRMHPAFEVYTLTYNQTLLRELRQRDPEVDAYMRKVEVMERQADEERRPVGDP